MRFSAAQATDIAGVLRVAAQAQILPRFRKLTSGNVRAKSGPLDLVTEADEAKERELTATLSARFPKAMILG